MADMKSSWEPVTIRQATKQGADLDVWTRGTENLARLKEQDRQGGREGGRGDGEIDEKKGK